MSWKQWAIAHCDAEQGHADAWPLLNSHHNRLRHTDRYHSWYNVRIITRIYPDPSGDTGDSRQGALVGVNRRMDP